MLGAKPMHTPMVATLKLSKDGGPLSDPSLYWHIVRALQYITLTRPDISFSVNKVCQYMSQPTETHWSAVKRILRYLKHTLSLGLQLRRSRTTNVNILTDVNWTGCSDDRRSSDGFAIFCGSNLITRMSYRPTGIEVFKRHSLPSEKRQLQVVT